MRPQRVILCGTTAGTTWRTTMIEHLIRRGVRPDQIVNPHLPPGVKYTPEHQLAERQCKAHSGTLVLVYICPATITQAGLSPEEAAYRSELLGPTSMFEIGKFAYSQPHRTGVVFDVRLFRRKRPLLVVEGLARELREDFGGQPPYLPSLDAAEEWIVSQLLG
jgi:hypothetical protein